MGIATQLDTKPFAPTPEICDYEGSPWRTKFWPGREYEDQAERIALAHMLPPRGTRLCEIGAGFGRLASYYAAYDRVILLDYSRSMLREAVSRLRGDARFIFVASDLYALPLADSAVDTAVTVRVLHHVADIPRAFAEISRIVRSGGTYLTEFANKRHLKARLRYAVTHRLPNPSTLEPYEFVKLNFDFHPRYIEDNLRSAHLIPQDSRAVSTFRVALLKRIVPSQVLAALDGLLQSPTSRLQLSPSIFVRATSIKQGVPGLGSALWRCPACRSTDLDQARDSLTCRTCSRVYPMIDGIIDFKTHM
jgi:SAM-dependent methyltransferase